MSTFPGPVKSDDAKNAERRRLDLRRRFRSVSRRIDQETGSGRGGGPGRWAVSPFEFAIGIAVLAFVLWAVGHIIGPG